MLGGRKDARYLGAVGLGDDVILGPKLLELVPTLRSSHLSPQDPSPQVVHEGSQGLDVSLDSGPNFLKGCELLGRETQLALVLKGHVKVLSQSRTESPEAESTAPEGALR